MKEFDTKQEAIESANELAKSGPFDRKVVEHPNGKYYVIVGVDTRIIYTAKSN